jgi:hypothetical protein
MGVVTRIFTIFCCWAYDVHGMVKRAAITKSAILIPLQPFRSGGCKSGGLSGIWLDSDSAVITPAIKYRN